jgi:hypothetical protein
MASITPLIHRTTGIASSAVRTYFRLGRGVVSMVSSPVEAALRSTRPKRMDDRTLARKVETELFRGAGSPTSTVVVDVIVGVVVLRGQVDRPAEVRRLEAQARAIPEVRDVRNLLRLPEPPPARTDSGRPQTTRAETPEVGGFARMPPAEDAVAGAEPGPPEQDATDGGRGPAPLGSS